MKSRKTFLAVFAAAMAVATMAGATTFGDQKVTYRFAPTGEDMAYRLYVPKSYVASKPAPLVVVLHGASGDENSAVDHSDIEAVAEAHGYIVLSVRGYNAFGGYGNVYPVVTTKETAAGGADFHALAAKSAPPPQRRSPPPAPTSAMPQDDYAEQPASVLIDAHIGELSEQETLAAIENVKASYAVDPKRIYLMGNSMGGVGTLYLAAKYPKMWSAISPSGGVIAAWSYPYERLRMAKVPVLFVHGEYDEHANPHWSQVMDDDAVAQGVDAKILIVPQASHGGAWTKVLPQIFDFFDAHPRTP